MIERVNAGDRDALRELLEKYTRPIYDRALSVTGNAVQAKTVTKHTLAEIVEIANKGLCPENMDRFCVELADKHAQQLSEGTNTPAHVPQAPMPSGKDYTFIRERKTAAAAEDISEKKPRSAAAPVVQTAQAEEKKAEPHHAPPSAEKAEKAEKAERHDDAQKKTAEVVKAHPMRGARKPKATLIDDDFESDLPDDDDLQDDDDLLDDDDIDDDEQTDSDGVPDLFGKDKKEPKSAGPATVLLILGLSFVVLLLVWMLTVMLMTRGVLPMADMGFAEWFNQNIFVLY